MTGQTTSEILTVYNQPFPVNSLLEVIRPETISPKVFDELAAESRIYDRSTILTAMTRQLDNSGLVPNLAGVCFHPDDAQEVLDNLGHEQLMRISRLEPKIQDELFELLANNRCRSLQALVVLDECQKEVIGQMVKLRSQSPLALAVRRANYEALVGLYRRPERLLSPLFDRVVPSSDQKMIYTGEPAICYPKRVVNGAVVEVWQFYFMPNITSVRLGEPFGPSTTGEVIASITPHAYRRGLAGDSRFDPRTPAGFMGLLGKVGGALPRLIARQVRHDEELKVRWMREQEISLALREWMAR